MDELAVSDDLTPPRELIGLLPAGGRALRLGRLPCSKEIYPVGYGPFGPDGRMQPKAAATGLLTSMQSAGAKRAFFILRKGKWDIPEYYGHGAMVKMNLAYLLMDMPYGAPYTIDQAYPFIGRATILFGFPDILFRPDNALEILLQQRAETGAPIVLGAFKADNPAKMDMLEVNRDGRVTDIVIKPVETTLTHTWILAVWGPRFSRFLHRFVQKDMTLRLQGGVGAPAGELYVGDVIRAAIKADWQVETVFFETGAYLDVGTPEDMQKVLSGSHWTF